MLYRTKVCRDLVCEVKRLDREVVTIRYVSQRHGTIPTSKGEDGGGGHPDEGSSSCVQVFTCFYANTELGRLLRSDLRGVAHKQFFVLRRCGIVPQPIQEAG